MQQKDELSQPLPSNMVRERPLRDRVGVYRVNPSSTLRRFGTLRVLTHCSVDNGLAL